MNHKHNCFLFSRSLRGLDDKDSGSFKSPHQFDADVAQDKFFRFGHPFTPYHHHVKISFPELIDNPIRYCGVGFQCQYDLDGHYRRT